MALLPVARLPLARLSIARLPIARLSIARLPVAPPPVAPPPVVLLPAVLLSVALVPGVGRTEGGNVRPVILPAEEQAAWNAVGRVNIAGFDTRSMCTGTLIAPDRVLTAAHCVLKHPGRFAEAGEVVFVAGWRAGEAAADARGAALAIHPGFRSGIEAASVRVADDLALLTLERALPGIAPIPVGPLPEAGALTILGYRADRPHIASRLGPCPVTTRAREAIVLACAVIRGTSGAPILVETEAGWRVVGVVSAASGGGTIAPRPDRWDALNALSPEAPPP